MKQPILRPVLLGIGVAFLVFAAWLWRAGCAGWAALEAAFPGLLLIGGLLIERWRYKPLLDRCPGPDWVATGERFVDPESGSLVTVFYKPATGERRYVSR